MPGIEIPGQQFRVPSGTEALLVQLLAINEAILRAVLGESEQEIHEQMGLQLTHNRVIPEEVEA
jgi:hypothetical protein